MTQAKFGAKMMVETRIRLDKKSSMNVTELRKCHTNGGSYSFLFIHWGKKETKCEGESGKQMKDFLRKNSKTILRTVGSKPIIGGSDGNNGQAGNN